MSSREDIFASIRQHTQTRYDKPDIADMKRLSYPDKMNSSVQSAVWWVVRQLCWAKGKM